MGSVGKRADGSTGGKLSAPPMATRNIRECDAFWGLGISKVVGDLGHKEKQRKSGFTSVFCDIVVSNMALLLVHTRIRYVSDFI